MKKVVILLVLALGAVGCGDDEPPGTAEKHTLTVLAASSLTGAFTDLAKKFEAEHHAEVKLVFDSSATLAEQAVQHAPGDVLATADKKTMDSAKDGGGIDGDPARFATNVIVLAVPADNPAKIDSLDDLNDKGVDYLTCVRTAPCGSAAATLLKADGVTRKPVSEEVDVKSVLAKVEAGESDAGLVYQTDVTASAGKVTGIDVPGAAENPNSYWVAVTADAGSRDLAKAWIELLTGSEGAAILAAAGFGTTS